MRLVFLDCQTTGMHPSLGSLLELAWHADGESRGELVRLPEGETLPPKVEDLTGIRAGDLIAAKEAAEVFALFRAAAEGAVLVAHYAQFEKAFLRRLFEDHGAPFPARWLCTHKIASRLYPDAPSRNIRALMGYLRLGDEPLRRAGEHLNATLRIWEKLEAELRARGLASPQEIEAWLESTKAPKQRKIEYHVERLRRLELPRGPGVYRMLSESGRVLYVGKATSLRGRVNSYFRGIKGRDRRKLEMLAQVHEIQVTECDSALEAALLENEEIKRLDPPYNVSLKRGRRQLVFASRDLARWAVAQDASHPLGPFSEKGALAALVRWLQAEAAGEPAQVFYEEVPEELLREGMRLFRQRHAFPGELPARALLAMGLHEWRVLEKLRALEPADAENEEVGDGEEDAEEPEEEIPLTAEEVTAWYDNLMVRAAGEYARARRLTRLLNCDVQVGQRILRVRGGRVVGDAGAVVGHSSSAWAGLGVTDLDRMSVLLAEVRRTGSKVETLPRPC